MTHLWNSADVTKLNELIQTSTDVAIEVYRRHRSMQGTHSRFLFLVLLPVDAMITSGDSENF